MLIFKGNYGSQTSFLLVYLTNFFRMKLPTVILSLLLIICILQVYGKLATKFSEVDFNDHDQPIKLCGKQLIKLLIKACKDCVVPRWNKRMKREANLDLDDLTETCCKTPCSLNKIDFKYCC